MYLVIQCLKLTNTVLFWQCMYNLIFPLFIPSAQKGCDILVKMVFFALMGAYGLDALSGKVFHLDSV